MTHIVPDTTHGRQVSTELIAKLIQGVQFQNGVEVQKESRQEIAA